jgi:hypothetical protein
MTAIEKLKTLAYYSEPAGISASGKYYQILQSLPDDIETLVRIIQGLLVHEYVAKDFYDFSIPTQRMKEPHIRKIEDVIGAIFSLNSAPLTTARPVDQRFVGVCTHYALFLVAILRAKDVPARARCGFSSYLNSHADFNEDHWVCEYWNEKQQAWNLVDAQVDDTHQKILTIEFNPLNVPHDKFIFAADAWNKCRSTSTEVYKFGLLKQEVYGLWFIAGDIMRDFAALNKVEVLPWDAWGTMPFPYQKLTVEELNIYDSLAKLTFDPESNFERIQTIYENDIGLRVSQKVTNTRRQTKEELL